MGIEQRIASKEEIAVALSLVPAWEFNEILGSLRRTLVFKDFKEAIGFVNKVAELAEKESHHPDISIMYDKVALTLVTHSIGGLSEKDFAMARKIDLL